MVDRGFGLEIEERYGSVDANGVRLPPNQFNPDWWDDLADTVDFQLDDEPVTRSGTSRMKKKARAGVLNPKGSTSTDADLQRLLWYMYGTLDNYIFTEDPDGNIHEFYGGEGKALPSFRGIAVYDMLKQYLYGLVIDKLSLEANKENVTIKTDWIYQTEESEIIGRNGATFIKPEELVDDLFLMFYDLEVELNYKELDGVSTELTFEVDNGHDVDKVLGFGSRGPQKRPPATNREIKPSLKTTLTEDTVDAILAAKYGDVNVLKPTQCKILKQPLKINIALCEDPVSRASILFPECTLLAKFDMSGADAIEVSMDMESLGTNTALLANGNEITTDMYVKIISNQPKLQPKMA